MRYGRSVEDGCLPVYSVSDEGEAQDLLVLACPTNIQGEFIAPELAQEQTLENLSRFSDRLDRAHEMLKKSNRCRCNREGEVHGSEEGQDGH